MHFGVWPDNSEVVSASSRCLASSTLRIWMMRKEHRIRIHSSFVLLSISYTALAAFVSSMYFQAYLYPGFVGLTVFGWIRLHLHRPYPRESRFVRLAVFVSIVGAFFSPFFFRSFFGAGAFTVADMLRVVHITLGILGVVPVVLWIWRDLIILGFFAPLAPAAKSVGLE
ncbi:MAG: hypothetical protein ACI9OD_001426 [Limisphaerales bacterium]|jgi:hypothetical protein